MPWRILLLDDDAFVRHAWRRAAATRTDLVLTVVETVEAVLLHLSQAAYDLVVCDFHLGKSATSAELVRDLEARGAPVVVLSGDVEDARRALARSAVPIISKPVRLDDLVALVVSLASRAGRAG
jgi:DNA-binding NtrC family response regulator